MRLPDRSSCSLASASLRSLPTSSISRRWRRSSRGLGPLPSVVALLHAERITRTRDELPRPRNPSDRGRVRGVRRRRSCWESSAPARGRSSARDSCRRAPLSCCSGRSRLAAEAHVLESEACASSVPTAARRSAPRVSVPREQRRQPARRPLPRLRRTRPLQRRVQHDVLPVVASPSPGRFFSRLREDPARAGRLREAWARGNEG